MKMLRKLLRDRKGITMTEVIIAMAAVILVSGAAISLLVASVQFDSKYDSQTRALNACESAVRCVRFVADDSDTLKGYLEQLGFDILQTQGPDGVTVYPFADGEVTVKVSESAWIVTFDDQVIYEKNLS